jgi:hypothetical protein
MLDEVIREPRYNNDFFLTCQRQLDAACARGITDERLEAFLVTLYTEQSKAINPNDIQNVTLGTLEQNILRPRQDLYLFILFNWITRLFMPRLDQRIAKNLLVFGVGRIFSAYNDVGVQYCTDADLNFVLRDSATKSDVARLNAAVRDLKQRMWDIFFIIVEVDASFTVLKERDINARLAATNEETRLAATLFYKGNARSLFVLYDNPEIRNAVFGPVRELPDTLIFENFLGNNPIKSTFARLREGIAQLAVISDSTQQKESVETLIGTRGFMHCCRQLVAIHPDLYPPQWCFSMKYTVNRVYDYVSAMVHAGYTLREIGFTGKTDPDYQFLCQSHRLMLFLQELIHIKLDTYNRLSDYSYISSERFTGFMDTPKGSFRTDFDEIVLSSNFLLASQRKHYLYLKQAVQRKQDILLSLTNEQMERLSEVFGFHFRHIDRGSGRTPASVPYTWGGVGFFVFSAVEARLSAIVDEKLVPALRRVEGSGTRDHSAAISAAFRIRTKPAVGTSIPQSQL